MLKVLHFLLKKQLYFFPFLNVCLTKLFEQFREIQKGANFKNIPESFLGVNNKMMTKHS